RQEPPLTPITLAPPSAPAPHATPKALDPQAAPSPPRRPNGSRRSRLGGTRAARPSPAGHDPVRPRAAAEAERPSPAAPRPQTSAAAPIREVVGPIREVVEPIREAVGPIREARLPAQAAALQRAGPASAAWTASRTAALLPRGSAGPPAPSA